MAKTFAICPDIHFPFHSKAGVAAFTAFVKETKPDHVLQLGDLYDQFSQSSFARSHNILTPADEFRKGRVLAEKFWEDIRRAAPKASLWQLLGNHDVRAYRRCLESAPELEHFVQPGIKEYYAFDGVTPQPSASDELVLDGIVFTHGFYTKLGDHARHTQKSTVCGHSHKPGIVYLRVGEKTIFEMNCGHVCDPGKEPFHYTKWKVFNTWCESFGYIGEHGPQIILVK